MNKSFKAICMLAISLSHFSTFCLYIDIHDTNRMLARIKQFLPKAPVILEAGGHYGEDTVNMKSIWPHATMHVFEPLPSSFERMEQSTRGLSHVFCYPYALTNYSGTTSFYLDIPNDGSSSINAPVAFNASEFDKTPMTVPCITLDEWARAHNVDHIDFMWLDMESHELYALQHGVDILRTVKVLYTEIAFEPVREGSGLYSDYKKFLEEQGFQEVGIRKHGHRFGDALFIKHELLSSY